MSVTSLEKEKKNVIFAVLLALFPVLCVIVGTGIAGKTLFDVWTPFSGWNDELFYYKQAEAMAAYGSPRGFFGYNESSSIYGGFGAWNPLILIPFTIFGKVFTVNVYTPMIFNIVIFALALFILGLSVRLDLKGLICAVVMLSVFTPVYRYILSYMPEIMLLSFTLLFFALFFAEVREHKLRRQILMELILVFLIAIRPYYAVFFLFPWLAGFMQKTLSRFLFAPAVALGLLISKLSEKYLQAPYYEEVYRDWIGKISTHGVRQVSIEVLDTLKNQFGSLLFLMGKGLKGESYPGLFFIVFFVVSLVLLLNLIIFVLNCRWLRPARFAAASLFCLLLGGTAVFMAIMIFYNLFDGFRHLFLFIVVDILALVLFFGSKLLKIMNASVLGVTILIVFILGRGGAPIPYSTPEERSSFHEECVNLAERMPLTEGRSWDNTVMVDAFQMELGRIEDETGYLEVLYMLPEGFALNYSMNGYAEANLESLRSGFILVKTGSELEAELLAKGSNNVAEAGGYRIYSLR